MQAPKILPWVARKAGISDDLALKLWRRATSEIETLLGEAKGSDFWMRSVERFLDLVEREATAVPEGVTPAPQLSWMWRHQSRMSMLSLIAAQSAGQAWQTAWKNIWHPQKAA